MKFSLEWVLVKNVFLFDFYDINTIVDKYINGKYVK